jgi:hypothetical protein
MYHPFPFQGPPKFTQIGIFGLKIKHLATLVGIESNAAANLESKYKSIRSAFFFHFSQFLATIFPALLCKKVVLAHSSKPLQIIKTLFEKFLNPSYDSFRSQGPANRVIRLGEFSLIGSL